MLEIFSIHDRLGCADSSVDPLDQVLSVKLGCSLLDVLIELLRLDQMVGVYGFLQALDLRAKLLHTLLKTYLAFGDVRQILPKLLCVSQ